MSQPDNSLQNVQQQQEESLTDEQKGLLQDSSPQAERDETHNELSTEPHVEQITELHNFKKMLAPRNAGLLSTQNRLTPAVVPQMRIFAVKKDAEDVPEKSDMRDKDNSAGEANKNKVVDALQKAKTKLLTAVPEATELNTTAHSVGNVIDEAKQASAAVAELAGKLMEAKRRRSTLNEKDKKISSSSSSLDSTFYVALQRYQIEFIVFYIMFTHICYDIVNLLLQ